MTHQLKIWPASFDAVASRRKSHEVRATKDRTFNEGDALILREWVPDDAKPGPGRNVEIISGHYTGRQLLRKVTYVTIGGSWGLPADICVLSIQ